MRLTIGHKTTGKFLKMIEVMVIDPHSTDEKTLYITDNFGNFITLTFMSAEIKRACLQELNTNGYATTYCDIQYYNHEMIEQDEYNREIDPFTIEEEMEYGRY